MAPKEIYLGWSLLIGNKRYGRELLLDITLEDMKGMNSQEVEAFLQQRLIKATKGLAIDMLGAVIPRASSPESVDEAEADYKKGFNLDGKKDN